MSASISAGYSKGIEMPSTLAWLDHDADARDRTLRILALFQERESRDELGLGGVRDSFADQLFPGTSTIQTRLRYMLIVPWVYLELEREHVSASEFAEHADAEERALVAPLMASDDRAGVFGRTAGARVKRLPSSVYWSGLGSWGIRMTPFSQDEYHRRIDDVYRQRREGEQNAGSQAQRGDDPEMDNLAAPTWHPRIPDPPAAFPKKVDFALTHEEASFLVDRIVFSHPNSLLAFLARECQPADVDAPWHHPDYGGFESNHKVLLHHAQLFSDVMHGASLLYNILLAERRQWETRIEEHRAAFRYWEKSLDREALNSWDLGQLWEQTMDQGHTITHKTRVFVEGWSGRLRMSSHSIADDTTARQAVQQREISLKKSRSRFRNQRALDQWKGRSGVGRLRYRWPQVSRLLDDLHRGLTCEADHA